MKEFDENNAVKAMRSALTTEQSELYDDDELLNLLDIIWDYYEQNGLLNVDISDEDTDEDTESLIPDIVDYACRMIRKDKNARLSTDHVEQLIRAEIAYEDSLLTDD